MNLIYYDSLCRLSWDPPLGEDTLTFNPVDVPAIALSCLLFEAKKHFKSVVLVDDFLAEDDHVDLLKQHLFKDVQRLPGRPHLVIGYNKSAPPQLQ